MGRGYIDMKIIEQTWDDIAGSLMREYYASMIQQA
jgi:hypothetical protein